MLILKIIGITILGLVAGIIVAVIMMDWAFIDEFKR